MVLSVGFHIVQWSVLFVALAYASCQSIWTKGRYLLLGWWKCGVNMYLIVIIVIILVSSPICNDTT